MGERGWGGEVEENGSHAFYRFVKWDASMGYNGIQRLYTLAIDNKQT